ncbi:hypothetical protein HWC53_gp150 [Bacillus phage vB_BmeM-Goe8]|uniref:Uncharacterized protein n=1 Tax=Bacillus phage vB_BmeM-Goe8 TaxID=2593638 RepID=A0A516KMW4_9CAUD|nr:hypothetical protein HWC53_gp150 [Bacillus phage vB_BmeM-Goe8]QDP42939.1 hypothetical protein Goe8_c01660 [Bacillus phage vB_BmeM-Goe8]
MENPEQDVKWQCRDCGHVWYREFMFIETVCDNIDCQSTNIEGD